MNRISFLVAVSLTICGAQPFPEPGSSPTLVPQAGGAASMASVVIGPAAAWVAVGDSNARVRIFDAASGRVSHVIPVAVAPNGSTTPVMSAHPSKDLIATITGQGALALYDVVSGAAAWKSETGVTCSAIQFSPDGNRIHGGCSTPGVPGKLPPGLLKTWDAATGRELASVDVPENITGVRFSPDATLCSGMQMRIPTVGKALLQSLKRNAPGPSNMINSAILDCQTGRKLAEFPGMIVALSGTPGRAIGFDYAGSADAYLYDVKSGERTRLPSHASGVTVFTPALSPDGSRAVITTPSGLLSIDMKTGQARTLPAEGLPYPFGSALARDNDRLALAQGDAVLLLSLANPAERRIIGNKDAALMTVADMNRMYQAQNSSASVNQPPAPAPQQKRGRFGLGSIVGTGGSSRSGDMAAYRAEVERREQARVAAQEAENAEGLKAIARFGSMSAVPAAPAFLDRGRFLAVRAADGWWSVWDTTTGNRLPFRKPPDYRNLRSTPESLLNPAELAELERSLTGNAQRSGHAPAAVGGPVACVSDDGAYTVQVTRSGSQVTAIELVSARDGRKTDLLATGLDFAALTQPAPPVPVGDPAPLCGIASDGSRIVVEVLSPERRKGIGKPPKLADMISYARPRLPEILAVYDLRTASELSRLERTPGKKEFDYAAGSLQFSPDGERLIAAARWAGAVAMFQTDAGLRMWDVRTGKRLLPAVEPGQKVLGFSNDGSEFYTSTGTAGITPIEFGVRSWDAQTGQMVTQFPDLSASTRMLLINRAGNILMGADRDNSLSFYDRKTGRLAGTLRAMQEGEWLVTTPSGLFDGSPRGWGQIAWRTSSGSLETSSGEIFFNEFYRPGLLAELLEGRLPQPPRTIAQLDRRQPVVSVTAGAPTTSDRNAKVRVTVREAAAGGGRDNGSGVRDVRLFRNGSLVKAWRGDISLTAGEAAMDAEVPLVSGENRITAYAFNRDNVRSQDAAVVVQSQAARRPGVAYLLAIGVNEYANREFNLNYAAPDAKRLAAMLATKQQELGQYAQVVTATLFDRDATRANIMLALSILGGRHKGNLPGGAPAILAPLRQVQPEDAVIVFFAGHGTAAGDRFYLVPHDLGYTGPRQSLRQSIQTVLGHSISDQDLERAFEPVDAAQLMLIVDACSAGKALDAEEQRRGPMNSKGLAQLAYEKGMHVLTAAQAYQAALESSKLGHGYLTYALVEEGLGAPVDLQPQDGVIDAIEWFDHAARRVPQLQVEAMEAAEKNGRLLTFESTPAGPAAARGLQTPRAYYRRDSARPALVIGKAQRQTP